MLAEGNNPIAKIIVKTMAKGKVENALKMNASNEPICLTSPVASLVKTFLSFGGELANPNLAKGRGLLKVSNFPACHADQIHP